MGEDSWGNGSLLSMCDPGLSSFWGVQQENKNTQRTSSKAYKICYKDIRSVPFCSPQLIDLNVLQRYKGKSYSTGELLCFISLPNRISPVKRPVPTDLLCFTPNHWLNTSNTIRFPSWHCGIV